MVTGPQLVLLLCMCGAQAQDIMKPTLNIIQELGKLKNMQERLKNLEEALQNQTRLVEKLSRENQANKQDSDSATGAVRRALGPKSTGHLLCLLAAACVEGTTEDLRIMAETKLEQIQKENEDRKVAFSASLLASGSGHTGPFSSVKSPLIYKNVFTNFGNGYDSNTGIFTAPLKGVYYFRFYAHSHDGTRMAVSLIKNEKMQASVYSWQPVSNGNAGNGVVLTLEKGDKVFTKLWDQSWVYDDPGHYTSFGGFLLFPL